jgi:ribose 5-phosphate isomerase B
VYNLAIGSDHAGYSLKQALLPLLQEAGYTLIDVGAYKEIPSDYPHYAYKAADYVYRGEATYALVLCGSGVGAAIVANKLKGIRALVAHTKEEACIARGHGDCNVLALSGRQLTIEEAYAIVQAFLDTAFSGEERHIRRIGQIKEIERHR